MASGTPIESSVRRRSEVNLQQVGRDAILHDRRLGQAHVINGAAARVWELCDGRSFDELVEAFGGIYGRPAADVRVDVEGVLDSFRALDLLE